MNRIAKLLGVMALAVPLGAMTGLASAAEQAQAAKAADARGVVASGLAIDQLHFDYDIRPIKTKAPKWQPLRVFDDGLKTYIQFPRSIGGQDAPVLFVVSGGQNRIVNYRMKNDMMIVDYAVDKAILVSGVGWRQQKITIRRGG